VHLVELHLLLLIGHSAHVLEDLLPYVCIIHDCQRSTEPFKTRAIWLNHLKARHESDLDKPDLTCNLCTEIVTGDHKARVAHVENHLIEIALSVLPTIEDHDAEGVAQAEEVKSQSLYSAFLFSKGSICSDRGRGTSSRAEVQKQRLSDLDDDLLANICNSPSPPSFNIPPRVENKLGTFKSTSGHDSEKHSSDNNGTAAVSQSAQPLITTHTSQDRAWKKPEDSIVYADYSSGPYDSQHTVAPLNRISKMAWLPADAQLQNEKFNYGNRTGKGPFPVCEHSFKVIKSDNTVIQWNCHVCHSGPYQVLYECQHCNLKACRPCAACT
jgi:hypothetical protein